MLNSKEAKFWLAFSENPIVAREGFNLYLYVLNNPSNFKDPFGLTIQATEGPSARAGLPCEICNWEELWECIFKLSPAKLQCIPCLNILRNALTLSKDPRIILISIARPECVQCGFSILVSSVECIKEFKLICKPGKYDECGINCIPISN
jgi:hypothetical protein